MIKVKFETYMNGSKNADLYVEYDGTRMKDAGELAREVKFLLAEFKTHCVRTNGAYHVSHFANWLNKYTNVRGTIGIRIDASDRLDF